MSRTRALINLFSSQENVIRRVLADFYFNMVTVYQAAKRYAQAHDIPPFGHHRLYHIGKFISIHFKQYWAPQQSDEVIAQAGFVRATEEGRSFLVVAYPDCFEPEMIKRIDTFLEMKRNEGGGSDKKQRAPKSVQPVPVGSTTFIATSLPGAVLSAATSPKGSTQGEIKKRKRIPVKQ
jgi:hypothetical protein